MRFLIPAFQNPLAADSLISSTDLKSPGYSPKHLPEIFCIIQLKYN